LYMCVGSTDVTSVSAIFR